MLTVFELERVISGKSPNLTQSLHLASSLIRGDHVQISPKSLATENYARRAIDWQTHDDSIYHDSIASHGKNI